MMKLWGGGMTLLVVVGQVSAGVVITLTLKTHGDKPVSCIPFK